MLSRRFQPTVTTATGPVDVNVGAGTVFAYLEHSALTAAHLDRHRRHGYPAEHPADMLWVTYAPHGQRDAGKRDAQLPLVGHHAGQQRRQDLGEIGVVGNDGGGFAAKFQDDPGDPLRARCRDLSADLCSAGEVHHVDVLVGDQATRSAAIVPWSGEDRVPPTRAGQPASASSRISRLTMPIRFGIWRISSSR